MLEVCSLVDFVVGFELVGISLKSRISSLSDYGRYRRWVNIACRRRWKGGGYMMVITWTIIILICWDWENPRVIGYCSMQIRGVKCRFAWVNMKDFVLLLGMYPELIGQL